MGSSSNAPPRVRPRKQPRQERARATRDAVLLGAERLLDTEGPDALTTNRIAEAAGVSIGSLYQYFPHKQAIIAALIDVFLARYFEVFVGALETLRDLPLEVVGEALARGVLELYQRHAKAHAPLYRQISALELDRAYQRQLARYVDEIRRFVVSRRDLDLRAVDVDAAAHVLVYAVEGVVRSIATDALACDPQAVSKELVRMLVSYLRRAP
jgi:AcrR family transcriptional regulator